MPGGCERKIGECRDSILGGDGERSAESRPGGAGINRDRHLGVVAGHDVAAAILNLNGDRGGDRSAGRDVRRRLEEDELAGDGSRHGRRCDGEAIRFRTGDAVRRVRSREGVAAGGVQSEIAEGRNACNGVDGEGRGIRERAAERGLVIVKLTAEVSLVSGLPN